ncbi:MAG: hypothetical protein SXQ77_07155, partial [Halobacteria archaeon]|nr:hypothetical protein [Halobacteria archaeon]
MREKLNTKTVSRRIPKELFVVWVGVLIYLTTIVVFSVFRDLTPMSEITVLLRRIGFGNVVVISLVAGLVSVTLIYVPVVAVLVTYYERNEERNTQRVLKYIAIIVVLSSLTIAVPFNGDPDADGLRSSLESTGLVYSPLVPDTDGVLDFEEDADVDGLTNIRELNLGSDMWSSDSDSDGLNDSTELMNYGTNPTKRDTDEDGFDDNVELEMETEPLDRDTDGDGILDSNETYTATVSREFYGMDVKVKITGKGNIGEKVYISKPANVMFTKCTASYYLSKSVQISVDGSFDHANVMFSYNESEVEKESAITVFA